MLEQTSTIPVVFVLAADPVGSGSRAFRGRRQRQRFHPDC
jgi:hypothetical protein